MPGIYFMGLSMLDKFKNTGKLKPYLIFGLTDETFSVLCGKEPSEDISKPWYMFWVTLLDQIYWVAGSAVGSLLGTVISFNTKGLDFVLTALFVVIFVGQWQETDNHLPAGCWCRVDSALPDNFWKQFFSDPGNAWYFGLPFAGTETDAGGGIVYDSFPGTYYDRALRCRDNADPVSALYPVPGE